MESRANYLMVGLFILVLSVGLLGFVIWLAKFQVEAALTRYDVIFKGSVTGLKEGSPVRFSGVRVGEVVAIRLDPARPSQVRVAIEIDKATPVLSDTEASLELEGLTGGRYILLHGGSPAATPLAKPDDGSAPVIAARASTLDRVLEGAPEILEGISLLLSRANELLNDENRDRIVEILANLATVTESIAERRDDIEALIGDTAQTMQNLRSASEALENMAVDLRRDAARLADQAAITLASVESLSGSADEAVNALSGDLRGLIGTIDSTTVSVGGAARQIEALISENREPLRDFSSTGLYEFSALLTESRALVRELGRITTELQRDPARFFFGDRQQGYETPN